MKKVALGIALISIPLLSAGSENVEKSLSSSYPANFRGESGRKAIKNMKQLRKQTGEKSEFESNADYIKRISATPLPDGTKPLVFVFTPTQTYNAESQHFQLSIESKDPAYSYSRLELEYGEKVVGQYVGTNAYGARATIQKIVSHAISLDYDHNEYRLASNGSGPRIDLTRIQVNVSPDSARKLKGNLAVAYAAIPKAPFYKLTKIESGAPTLSNPYESVSITENIISTISHITIFNRKTGEIHKTFDLQELIPNWRSQYQECKEKNPSTFDRMKCERMTEHLLKFDL